MANLMDIGREWPCGCFVDDCLSCSSGRCRECHRIKELKKKEDNMKKTDDDWGHGCPPPGYGPCTRPDGHEGPCAMPLEEKKKIDEVIVSCSGCEMTQRYPGRSNPAWLHASWCGGGEKMDSEMFPVEKKQEDWELIEVGSVVQLQSGGPKMTVQAIFDGQARCAWFGSTEVVPQTDRFSLKGLRRVV